MANQRHRNADWTFPTDAAGRIEQWSYVQMAILMDIRDELQKLNRVLACPHFQAIPRTLYEISKKVTPPKKRKSRSVNV